MNKAEFIKVCGLRGICTQQIAAMYAARFADDKEYADSDFEDAYRFADKMSYCINNLKKLNCLRNTAYNEAYSKHRKEVNCECVLNIYKDII